MIKLYKSNKHCDNVYKLQLKFIKINKYTRKNNI